MLHVYWWWEQTYRQWNIKQQRSLFNGETHIFSGCTHLIFSGCACWSFCGLHWNWNLLRRSPSQHGCACQTVISLAQLHLNLWIIFWWCGGRETKCAIMGILGRWRYHSQLHNPRCMFLCSQDFQLGSLITWANGAERNPQNSAFSESRTISFRVGSRKYLFNNHSSARGTRNCMSSLETFYSCLTFLSRARMWFLVFFALHSLSILIMCCL